MANIDLASNSALLSVAEKLDTQNAILMAKAGGEGFFPITDWSTVQSIVRMGLASKVFSVGDSFACNHEEFGTLTWDIVGIDCDTPADKTKKHSLTLMLHQSCAKLPFSEEESLLYCKSFMPAGAYTFSVTDPLKQTTKHYSFTTTMPHYPPHIFFFESYPQKTMTVFENPDFSTVLETLTVYDSLSGTSLGNADGTNLNYSARIINGNELWKKTSIRQWLSSDKENWDVYSAEKGPYNMKSSYSDRVGFLNKIDPEFTAVLGKVVKRTNCNKAIGGYVESEDLVFLPSLSELYCTTQKSGDEGAAYPYFVEYSDNSAPSDSSDSNRIKTGTDNGRAVQYLTRSSDINGAMGYVWRINASGVAEATSPAYSSDYVVPMCCIV